MEGGAVRPLSPASLPEPGHPVSSGARALGSPELARSCPRSACGWRGGWQAAPPLRGQMSLLLRVRNHGPIIRVHLNPLLVPSLGRTRLVRGRAEPSRSPGGITPSALPASRTRAPSGTTEFPT